MSDSDGRRNSELKDEKDEEEIGTSDRSLHELVRKFCDDVTRYLNKCETLTVTVRGDESGRRYEVCEERSVEAEKRAIEKRFSDNACQLEARRPLMAAMRESRPLSLISSVSSTGSSGYSTSSSQWSANSSVSQLERCLEESLAERDRLYLEILQLRGTVATLEPGTIERNEGSLVRRTAVRRKGTLTPISEKTMKFKLPEVGEFSAKFKQLSERVEKLKDLGVDEKTKDSLRNIRDQLDALEVQGRKADGERESEELREALRDIERVVEGLENEHESNSSNSLSS